MKSRSHGVLLSFAPPVPTKSLVNVSSIHCSPFSGPIKSSINVHRVLETHQHHNMIRFHPSKTRNNNTHHILPPMSTHEVLNYLQCHVMRSSKKIRHLMQSAHDGLPHSFHLSRHAHNLVYALNRRRIHMRGVLIDLILAFALQAPPRPLSANEIAGMFVDLLHAPLLNSPRNT